MKRLTVLFLLLCVLLLLLPATARASVTFDQAVDKLLARHYPQKVEAYLCGLGTTPMGFRTGGSSADNAAAQYIARQMQQAGLVNVHLEPIEMDAWELRGASVTVGDRVMNGSSYTCVPGTPAEGITGEVVYVGRGTKAEFDAVGDVTGKVVIIDFTDDHSPGSDTCWSNCPANEADIRGATAIILTTSEDYLSFFEDPDTLGSNDGEHDLSWPPMVYICRTDGDWLKEQAAAGPTEATVKLDVRMTLASEGGIGYNVMGELPGRVKNGEKVVFTGHHDAFFQGATDNTTAPVAQLTVAKAMKMAGYKPRRTIVFISHTGEEGGIVDSWYDWSFGSWYSATKIHTDWPGKVAGLLNFEGAGAPEGQMFFGASPELVPMVETVRDDNPDLKGPTGPTEIYPVVDCGSDQWPFSAAGIPSVVIWGWPDTWWSWNYHTPNDSIDKVDWDYFGKCVKFFQRMAVNLDESLVPYDLTQRAADIEATVDVDELTTAGAREATAKRLARAVSAFKRAANAFEARKDDIAPGAYPDVSRLLMKVEKALNRNFIALSWWDDTIYPHQQVLWDLQGLNTALDALASEPADKATALATLGEIGYTWYGLNFSRSVYLHELNRHDPDYWAISWAGQGHLPQPINVLPEYRKIEKGEMGDAVAGLTAERARQIRVLNRRLAAMADVLERLPEQIAAMH